MNGLLRHIVQKPFWLFLVLFAIIALADLLFGESTLRNFVPAYGGLDEEFFGTLWFCGVMALVATAIVMIITSKKIIPSLPWVLGASAAILLCSLTVYNHLANGFYGEYRSFTDSVYHPIRHAIPYYFPFQTPREYDYMLSTSSPVFLKASALIVTPMLAGYAVIYARKSHKINTDE